MLDSKDHFRFFKKGLFPNKNDLSGIVFIDLEVGASDKKTHDFGALKEPDVPFHSNSKQDFADFISKSEYLCGHNIIHHDLAFLHSIPSIKFKKNIDTLYLSPLLFPQKPYHKLLKDEKLQADELNNPLNDCRKTRELFYDEVDAFQHLPKDIQTIYFTLLRNAEEFAGFFDYLSFNTAFFDIEARILHSFENLVCTHAPLKELVKNNPVELAYALALIRTDDRTSITPPWLLYNYPQIENVFKLLRHTPCRDNNCSYCKSIMNIHLKLQEVFEYNEFRKFGGEPMQEQAVQAAVDGESILTIFPTGGGKSLTFQLPAIMAGQAVHGLTVIISPLQSLMKDQVDNLNERGIHEAVTINGLLDPISRANAFERVADGSAALLYISPEMLRSRTIEKLLLARNVVRFVVDEAHCFSAWGQDFRVDYLYIGKFIKNLQEKKRLSTPIPVSCFTATAKQKVISDIRDYFKREIGVELTLFASPSARENLHYSVIYAETEEEKYNTLRSLMLGNSCPTIIYVSRTKKTLELANKLTKDGLQALPFNGKMDSNDKIANQNAFIANKARAMVATSAFGMGVDKKDVGLVVHYDISDSLENYIQEAGRAGRDPKTDAKCYVLYSDHDLDKHFLLLNQTKVSISEIQQVWKAVKDFTKQRKSVCCSALEIARQAGWNEERADVETRVRTAINALEDAGYVSRGNNVPQVFATGILVRNMEEARQRIVHSAFFMNDKDRDNAVRIIKSLISSKSRATALDDEAESRVDYLADMLGMTKESVINTVNLMRQEGVLADSQDMSAYIEHSENKTKQILEKFSRLESFILTMFSRPESEWSYKSLNERVLDKNITSSIKDIRTVLYYLSIKSYIKKSKKNYNGLICVELTDDYDQIKQKQDLRKEICRFIVTSLYKLTSQQVNSSEQCGKIVQFSVNSLHIEYLKQQNQQLFHHIANCHIDDVKDALLYLSKIGAMKLEGGFLVIYNAMEIRRLKEMKYRYKIEDYRTLDEFYKQKRQQIHIVGEYANMMVRNYPAALQYVQDYFHMDYSQFISKYFKGDRLKEIDQNITPAKFRDLFGNLSKQQNRIISDKQSKYIVVAAGPGSGKTRVLVHKLASLLLMEDVKHDQLLMLTFSRAAATEFKQRLINLIGNAAYFVEIKTFHAFSFDLLGIIGSLEESKDVVARAVQLIESGEAEQGHINKTVLVIDEAQDMDKNEYALVKALMRNNEEMRVIAVGDDDQNIYQFRGSDSRFMQSFIDEMGATKYEMTENFRSAPAIVTFANHFSQWISNRMKTSPCSSIQTEAGTVQIIQHESDNLEIPLVLQLKHTYHSERACVLTNTNEEAARILGLLTKEGINAKLIQTTNGFHFGNLAEIRYFRKQIKKERNTPVISEDLWNRAKMKTLACYEGSTCLDFIREFFRVFESTNNAKYWSDLNDFIVESNLEDFCGEGNQTVFVSTIHKAKGREFDTVYMLLNKEVADTDEKLRKLYVGITRAKQCLYIHCNTSIFSKLKSDNIAYFHDLTHYPLPQEITMQLTMHDVNLNFFKGKKEKLLKLRSGMPLIFDQGYLLLPSGDRVIKLSTDKKKELQSWVEKGYSVHTAKIKYIIAWKGKDDHEETAVLLPEIALCQMSGGCAIS